MPEGEEAKKKPKKAKKKAAGRFSQPRGERGKTTLVDFVSVFLAGGPKRFHDIVERVGEQRKKAGFQLSPSFSGQVWHATNRVASPTKERGVWKLDKAKMKAKPSGNPKKAPKSKPKAKEQEPDVASEAEPEGEEDGDEEDDEEDGEQASG